MFVLQCGCIYILAVCTCVCAHMQESFAVCVRVEKDGCKKRWCEQERHCGFEILFETPNTLGSVGPYIVPCDQAEERQTEPKKCNSCGAILSLNKNG